VPLPRIHAGRRRRLLWRLIANGVAQAALFFGLALLFRAALSHHATAPVWLFVVGLVAAGLARVGLRVLEARTTSCA
jgi:hypothetical protein